MADARIDSMRHQLSCLRRDGERIAEIEPGDGQRNCSNYSEHETRDARRRPWADPNSQDQDERNTNHRRQRDEPDFRPHVDLEPVHLNKSSLSVFKLFVMRSVSTFTSA